jgi:dUTP pyrophosphatase
MKIEIKCFDEQSLPQIIDKGDWIDLRTNETVEMNAPYANVLSKNRATREVEFDFKLIPLGVAMKLPKGFEAVVLPRSSTFKKKGIILANSQGVIDNSYNGNDDQWWFPAIALRKTTIERGERICQFRIQLSQSATPIQKLKWLFTRKIELIPVDNLNLVSRGGIGSTGNK